MPIKKYTKFEHEGDKVYIPILSVVTSEGRLTKVSRKLFSRAQPAQDHATKVELRYYKLKEAERGKEIQTRAS